MASQTLPLDDLELEIEGLIIDSDVNNKKRDRTYGSRRCSLLFTVSISMAIVVAVLWPTHGHYVKKAADQVKNTIEGMGSNSTAQGESTGDETVSGNGGNTSDGAAESETPPTTTGTSPEDVWLPAPFTVRTENPPSTKVLKEYAKTWGTWKLGDLPKMDRKAFCGDHSHCDVPSAKFPSGSWQTDQTFLPKFLEEADKLVDRAMNAILAEYGKKPGDATMFINLTYKELDGRRELRGQQPLSNGGWTTKRSMQGLARRILHAIMTRDTFTFVMGGHSAAAGHGNHFKQSYTMQFHKVMEPVFSYLGVQLVSRNLAQGGLGTVQSSLGAADIYGDEIDFMIWDSGMTEGRDARAVDMFGRQALLAHRVPVLWNLNAPVLEKYYKECDADVGLLGTGMQGMPVSKDETQVLSLPFATQYMSCDKEHQQMCNGNRFRANCWVERPDVTPPTKQKPKPGSQVKWHPGFRVHQLTGRILAFTVLTALKEAIDVWKNAEGNVLPDDAWHVTAYYENIRSKAKNLTGSCENYKGSLPVRMCSTQMRARTEFTPRANPEKTSIRSILKTGDYKPKVKGKVLYGGPDVRNPMFDIPDGQVDVLAILNNERKFPDDQQPRQLSSSVESSAERRTASDIVPGKGYELKHPAGYCDGSYNAICKREAGNECLLYGHHDDRGGLLFHEYSGWIVMEVPKVRQGIIVVKFETWHRPTEVSIANGWKTMNNERNLLQRTAENDTAVYSERHERKLKQKPPEYCNDFHFDYAVDGKMKTYNKAEFQKAAKHIQRVVEVVTLLDDPSYVKEGEEKNVEVAVRIRGCGATKTFSLTHVYWA